MSVVKRTIVDELHKVARINFPRRKYVMKGVGESLQADLVSLMAFSDVNRGYKYLLTCIDIFSKYAFAIPLKTKKGEECAKAFESILKSYKYSRFVKNLQVDRGGEFYCLSFKKLMDKYGINMYSVHTKVKCAFVERLNLTLKRMCWKNFGYIGKYNWIDHIETIVKKYNETKHSKIKMAPINVSKQNEQQILSSIYHNNVKFKDTNNKLKVGMHVRISDVYGSTFRRGFETQWSTAIFKIVEIQKTFPLTYKLRDFKDNLLDRSFYRQELQPVKYKDAYLTEIIKRTKDGVYVSWLGFDKTYNSFIKEKDLL